MFNDSYPDRFTLAFCLLTFGQSSDVVDRDAIFPASADHGCVLLAAIKFPSHVSSECTLACPLVGDNFNLILTSLKDLQLENNGCTTRLSHAKDLLQPWPGLRQPSAQGESQKLGDAPDSGTTARLLSIQSFTWSAVPVPDLKPLNSQSEHVLHLPSILHGLLLNLQPLVKTVPHSDTPRNNGRESRYGQRSSANTGMSRRQPSLSSSHTGGGPGIRVAVFSMNDPDNEAQFGCFIGKLHPSVDECGRARRRWQHVRSLCRSGHLFGHIRAGHLTATQLNYITALASARTTNDDAETWRDCFVYLYPEFGPIRHRLNPYVGQALLDPEPDQRRRLQRPQQRPFDQRGSHSTSSQPSDRSGHSVPVRADMPIDGQPGPMQAVHRTPAISYSNTLPNPKPHPAILNFDYPIMPWNESQSPVPTFTSATTLTTGTEQQPPDEHTYTPGQIPANVDFLRPPTNDIVPHMIGGELPYGPNTLPEFAQDVWNLNPDLEHEECEIEPVMYINPRDIYRQPPDDTQRR